MQFPVLLVTPPPAGEDHYEIHEGHPVTASRAVNPNATPSREQGGSKGGRRPEQQKDTQEGPPQPHHGQERRTQCRRIVQQSILLDTRAGRDRRRPDRSVDGAATNVDEEA